MRIDAVVVDDDDDDDDASFVPMTTVQPLLFYDSLIRFGYFKLLTSHSYSLIFFKSFLDKPQFLDCLGSVTILTFCQLLSCIDNNIIRRSLTVVDHDACDVIIVLLLLLS
jgi:hypothetical protein